MIFLQYENEEAAEKTRQMLHGTRWPESNPKSLRVEYATEEQLNFHRSGDTVIQARQPPQPSKVGNLMLMKVFPLKPNSTGKRTVCLFV